MKKYSVTMGYLEFFDSIKFLMIEKYPNAVIDSIHINKHSVRREFRFHIREEEFIRTMLVMFSLLDLGGRQSHSIVTNLFTKDDEHIYYLEIRDKNKAYTIGAKKVDDDYHFTTFSSTNE